MPYRLLTIATIVCCAVVTVAQTMLPPVFGTDTPKADELSRMYITPKRIVWTQGNIRQQEILLNGTIHSDIQAPDEVKIVHRRSM